MLTDKNFIILELNPKLYLMLKKSWPFLLLAVLSFTVHFAFLSYPAQVVFDEVHFGKFVAGYFTHQYFFDIHPHCSCHLIMIGKIYPPDCPLFAKKVCNPENPFGPCMVSMDGTCRIWYRYGGKTN